ncbi:MAG TPA: hypothetical protein VGS62_11470 [Streptosporangiaceae bacterium]|nr:hypothetical protein [Streptosporangiaceae bacterium]
MTTRGPLLGWNLYTGPHVGAPDDQWTFVEFVPAPDLDAKLSMLADLTVLEIEGSQL